MTEALISRLEELVRENEALRNEYVSVHAENVTLRSKVSQQKYMGKFLIKQLGERAKIHEDHLEFMMELLS